MAKEVTVTTDNFESEVIKSDVPVLVDFWADWCMPCKMIAPILEEISAEYDGKVKIGKLNVDEQADIAAEYGIVSIPTILVFHQGEMVKQHVGAAPRPAIEGLFKDLV